MKKVFSKQNKALLSELVRTDFKLRYQGSALGYTWSLLRPLFMFTILYLVFALIFNAGKDVPHYPVYLLLGIVLWNFFGDITSQSLSSIVARGDLIRKIRIPRWLIIVSVSIGALINLLLNLLVVIIFGVINGVGISKGVVFMPVYLLEIYLFALGVSLVLSSLFVRYRDVSYIWDVIMQVGFYATPIIYAVTTKVNMLAGHPLLLKLLYINPVAQSIQGARYAIVTNQTLTISKVWGSSFAFLLPITVIVITLVFGVSYFKKHAKNFAEDL